MAFPVGHKKIGGRVKNVPNKRTASFLEILERENFCPATALIHIYRESMKNYDNLRAVGLIGSNQILGVPSEADRYLKTALDAAKDIASYSFPKLKAIEQSKPSPTDGMTQAEKLAVMKHYVAALEHEVGIQKGS